MFKDFISGIKMKIGEMWLTNSRYGSFLQHLISIIQRSNAIKYDCSLNSLNFLKINESTQKQT